MRRFFGGRQPLCGMGVMSRINLTRRPASCNPRMAVSRPGPAPFTMTRACCIPCVIDCLAAVPAAVLAAKGVPFLAPRKPQAPAEDQEITSPRNVVMVMIVLLKLA